VTALEFTIPAPCDWLNSNQRLHRMVSAAPFGPGVRRRTRRLPSAHAWAPFEVPVHIVCTIHKTRAGRWDAGNLYGVTAKAIVDGLVDAGVIPDDSNEWVTGPDMRAGEKRAEPCVVVRVEAIP
jgi:crossover junction endodeoxyribonuclease RusA